jgi:hypothetical protein
MSTEFVKLSVQGSLFILSKEMIMSQDWILNKIISSTIPWQKVSDDQIYIDIDPSSFRFIVSVLNGQMVLPDDMKHLTPMDLDVLKVTARYLMLPSSTIEIHISNIQGEMQKLEEQIEKLVHEKDGLVNRLQEFESFHETIKLQTVQKITCGAYRTHRPYNRCGCTSFLIGPLDVSEFDENVKCDECGNDRSRLYGRKQQFAVKVVDSKKNDYIMSEMEVELKSQNY